MATWQNIGGTWKSGYWWQNVAGVWKQCNIWQNIAGVWQNLSTVFTPDGGAVTGSGQFTAVGNMSCNVPAVWTYTLSGFISCNVASGASATNIQFTTTASGGSPGNRVGRTGHADVTGVANGVTRTFTVDLETYGDNNV